MQDKRIAIVGLDTSHAVAFTTLIQSADPAKRVVEGMRVTQALRFPSAFQPEAGQDQRQAELEALGVTLKPSIDAVLENVDAVFLEINDPALHLDYFTAVADRGLPVFIDKPLAANTAEGRRICELAAEKAIPVWSASSLRFIPSLIEARATVANPLVAHTFGALGKAARGSDLVWYGVHAVEMLTAGLGVGATEVRALEDSSGIVLMVHYADGRRGLVECLRQTGRYGGRLQNANTLAFFDSGKGSPYVALMGALRDFVCDGKIPVPLSDAFEILAILEAGERSLASGGAETVAR
jgi:hypothetical protein